ncbi:hypothetical protein BXT84_01400 [Sulfobacillus thermotolerans]|uniref:Glycosyltransferase RgtA/B/C/D-like domain-containing protein n=1 Tax=Sulfobacillus thermotolerans TaxID=338644 RepID=A0ABM6RN36_9FIRM|nr:hypothetical protein BXT84_01400 [Sulfobacillus thermotolerans]
MPTRIDHRVLGWMLVLLAASMIWAHDMHTGLSGDVYWQWEAGRYMLAHHMVLHRDVFSYTLFHKPWVTEEWGYEVLLAAMVKGFGPIGFWLLSAGVGTATVVLLSWLLHLRGTHGIKNGLLVLMATPGLLVFVKDRPQTLSYALFVLMLIILTKSRKNPHILWAAVPLLWFWTNVHGSFLLGFLLLGLEGLWGRLPVNTQRVMTPPTQVGGKQWATVFVVALLLSFLNPNGPGLWAYSWHVTFSHRISDIIAEWQSPDFHDVSMVLLILVPMFVLVLWALFGDTPMPWPDFFLAAGLFYATMKSVRFLPYWDLQWPVLLGVMVAPWEFRRASGWIGAPFVAALSVVIVLAHPIVSAGVESGEPVLAANYLQHHSGHVFNMYHWGGYLIYRHIPVFIDGRTDFYLQGPEITQYMDVKNLTTNPTNLWTRYNIRYVLWAPGTALATYLLSQPAHWRVVIRTKTAILFQHRGLWHA